MPNTIVYTVNPQRARTDLYKLKVLTVATDFVGGSLSESLKCSIGDGTGLKRGAAGHVTLTYAEGGQLVTSMGHWIELTRIDVSLESLMRVAARNFGDTEVDSFNAEYNALDSDDARYECVQKRAYKMVQQSAPSRMKCRTKY